MSWNHCAAALAEAAARHGAPDIEASWSENREKPQYCPTCRAFLRRDGGCTRCGNTGVPSDGGILATAPAAAPVWLSCGHQGSGQPGEQVRCTECGGWAIAGKSDGKFNLPGANLGGANLTKTDLKSCTCSDRTKWTEGFTPPATARRVE